MSEKTSVRIAFLMIDEEIRLGVSKALEGINESEYFEVLTEIDDAQVVIADYVDPLSATPFPELVNQSGGKPLIIVTKNPEASFIRRLFIEGATDVIALSDLDKYLAGSIHRAVSILSTEKLRTDLLSTELLYLRELSDLAGSGVDLNSFFDRIVNVIAEIMDAEIVSLMLLNERFQSLWIAAACGLDEEIIRSSSVPLGEGISGRVAKLGRPLLLQDVEEDPEISINQSAPKYNTKGLLSVPISVRNKVIGVINVNNKKSSVPFKNTDLNILALLSNQTGLAIDNVRLFADIQSKAQSLQQAYDELKRLNKAKTDLIINLSHEIKTPLTAIIGYVDLLLSSSDHNPKKVRTSLERIALQGRHLNRLAERIITYFALQTKSVDWEYELVPLRQIVFFAVESLKKTAFNANVEVVINGPSLSYDIYCDVSHIQEVFLNLFENAILFNKPGGRVLVSGQAINVGNRAVEILVVDTGVGVPDSLIEKIFDGFVQTENLMSDKPEGLGIGLAMSRAIIEAHNGTIRLTSNSPQGATFTVTLPLK